ncbi:MAG: hypothetical protein JO276_14675 [Sphingomonadaceae bacterium]|nr:hypothetical protein [Sphingomonadaceae bacterium]
MAEEKLDVVVSSKANISGYHMVFRGTGVDMEDDRGEITHPGGGAQHYLEWSMLGEPGGSMKVQVLRKNGDVVAARNASKIPNGAPVGYDRIKVTL